MAAATSASIHKDGCLSVSLPLLASSNSVRARVEVEEGRAGGVQGHIWEEKVGVRIYGHHGLRVGVRERRSGESG